MSRSLREGPLPPGVDVPAYARADRLEGRPGHDMTLTGDAQLRRAGSVLAADRITYYEADDEVMAVGAVRLNRDGNVFQGPQLRLKLDTNTGTFLSPGYFLGAYGGRGRAEQIEFLGPGVTRATDATYTTCGPDDPAWHLSTRSLTIDQNKGVASGRSARLTFMGLRVLGLPVFGFPLGDERKSGFLPPMLSINSRTGIDVVAPYYWNIAPNRDFTLYPRMTTKRGLQVGGEFRYLEPRFSGAMQFEWVPSDRITGQSRSFYGMRHAFSNIGGWSGGWTVRGVSDDHYFVDFGRSILVSGDRILPRHFYAARSLGAGWTMQLDVMKWQSILDARPGPYERLPQMQFRQVRRDLGGFDIDTLVELTQFSAPLSTMPQGWRSFAYSQVSWPVLRPGWSIIPKMSVHASRYALDHNGPYDTDLSRVIPTFSVDGGMVFERQAQYFGRNFTQTLEPRLFVVHTPYRDQRAFPVFDSATVDMSFGQLFSENTFVGNDRIADATHVTGAVFSRFIDPASGAERLRLGIGQRLNIREQRVTLPGVPPVMEGRSDILLGASGELSPTLRFDSGLQYGIETGRVPRYAFKGQWRPRPGQVLNLGLRYRTDQIGQADASWRWKIGGRWTTMGRINWSYLDTGVDPQSGIPNTRGLVQTVLGFEYEACCWTARVVGQRYKTGVNTETTGVFVQLELRGLGRIGSDPFDILRRNIPGYGMPQSGPITSSRYFGYE